MTGVQNVKAPEIKEDGESNYGAQVAVKKDTVKAVVIKAESNDAVASNLMYIRERSGGYEKDENGNMIYKYTVVMMRPNERVDDEVVIYSDDDVRADTFVAYTAKEHANYSNFYDLRDHSSLVNRTTGTYQAQLASIVAENGSLLYLGNYAKVKGDTKDLQGNGSNHPEVEINTAPGAINTNGGVNNIVRITNAEIVDLRWDAKTAKPGDREIRSIDDLKWYFKEAEANIKLDVDGNGWLNVTTDRTLEMQLVVNDNPSSDYFRDVALIVITDIVPGNSGLAEPAAPPSTDAGLKSAVLDPTPDTGLNMTLTAGADKTNTLTTAQATGTCGKKIVFTLSDENATLEVVVADTTVNGALTGNDFTLDAEIGDGEKLVVKVTPQDTNAEPKTYTYTFTVDAGATSFTSSVVDKTKDTSSLVSGIDLTRKLTGNTLALPVLDTGNEDDITTQVKEAYEKLGYTEVMVSSDTTTQWSGGARDSAGVPKTITAEVSRDLAKITVDGTVAYYVPDTTLDSVSEISLGNVRETKVGSDTPVDHVGAKTDLSDSTNDKINAGSIYVDAAFVIYKDSNHGAVSGFDVAATDKDDKAISANDKLEIGATVTITLKATAKKQANDAMASPATLVFSDTTAAVTLGANNTADKVASNKNGTVTFKNEDTNDIINENDTFAVTYTVVKAAVAAGLELDPTVTYTDPAN